MSPTTPEQKHNFHNLFFDILWWGVLTGSTLSFLSLFLARLGATGPQLGLLTAGPALVSLVFSLPAGYWLRKLNSIKTTAYASLIARFGYLILALLPSFFPEHELVWMLLLVVLLASLPGTLVAISFNALFADLVPPEWRPWVVGRRNALLAFTIIATSLTCGYLLDHLPFPFNYQIVFAIGALGAGLSSYHLFQLKPYPQPPLRSGQPLNDLGRSTAALMGDVQRRPTGLRYLLRSSGRSLLRLDLLRGPFGILLLTYFFFYFSQYFPAPLFPLYLVNELRLSDGLLSIGNSVFYLTMLLASIYLHPLIRRFGTRRMLSFSTTSFAIYPLLVGLAYNPATVITAYILGGGVWGLTDGGLINNLMNKVPEDDRPAHMALHHLTLNVAILAGSLIGPLTAALTGLRWAVLISAGLRLSAGLFLGSRRSTAPSK